MTAKVKIRSAYDIDLNDVETGLACLEPSLTKQSEASACDVNQIVSRWLKSGGAIDLSERVGQFLDVSEIPDYHTCQTFIATAQSMFGMLPSNVRERFDNDPGKFLDYASDPKNFDGLVELGLAKKRPVDGAAGPTDSPSAATAAGAAEAAPDASASVSDAKSAP